MQGDGVMKRKGSTTLEVRKKKPEKKKFLRTKSLRGGRTNRVKRFPQGGKDQEMVGTAEDSHGTKITIPHCSKGTNGKGETYEVRRS